MWRIDVVSSIWMSVQAVSMHRVQLNGLYQSKQPNIYFPNWNIDVALTPDDQYAFAIDTHTEREREWLSVNNWELAWAYLFALVRPELTIAFVRFYSFIRLIWSCAPGFHQTHQCVLIFLPCSLAHIFDIACLHAFFLLPHCLSLSKVFQVRIVYKYFSSCAFSTKSTRSMWQINSDYWHTV